MKDKLIMLHNTLLLIDTKGESTVHMADCIKFVAQLISDCEKEEEDKNIKNIEE